MSALLQTYQNKCRLLTDEVKRWKRAFRNYNLIASDCVCQIVHLSAVMQQISLSSLFFCFWAAFYDMLLLLEWWGCDSMLSQHSRCLILPIKKTHLNTNTGYDFKQTRENVKKIPDQLSSCLKVEPLGNYLWIYIFHIAGFNLMRY